jgi:hypothetical protein
MSFFQEYLDDLVMEKIANADIDETVKRLEDRLAKSPTYSQAEHEMYSAAKGQKGGRWADYANKPVSKSTEIGLQSDIISRMQREEANRRNMLEKAKKYKPSTLEQAQSKLRNAGRYLKDKGMAAHKYLASHGKYVPHAVYGTAGLASAAGAYHLATRKKRRD